MENSQMLDAEFKESSNGTYIYTPSVDADGFIDYTGVSPDKIYLANRKSVLSEEYPSFLPPVHIRRDSHYDVPVYKISDNVYLLKETDEPRRDENGNLHNSCIYKVSLDVYAALINYHLEFDRAAFAAISKRNEEARKKALESGLSEYKVIREKSIPRIPGIIDVYKISDTYTMKYMHKEHKPSRVSLKSTKSNRMGIESFYFIQDMHKALGNKISRNDIFKMHRECLDDINQKILDMELQKADWESTWTKGRETSYGDTNLDDALLQRFGIRIKRQNGEDITDKDIEDLSLVLDRVHSVFGDVSEASRTWGLKVSHAGNTKMHASKYDGIFTPYYRAIGVSFANGNDEASLTAIHEYAHFMDHLSGKEYNAWHSSDIPGTTENHIAVTFRNEMKEVKGAYWSRTCECFARAIEEYAHIQFLREQETRKEDSQDFINKANAIIDKPGMVDYITFCKNIEPRIDLLLEHYKDRFVTKDTIMTSADTNPETLINNESVITNETRIRDIQKEIYELAVEKNKLDKEVRNISEKINEEKKKLIDQELRRISSEIEAIDRQQLLHSESTDESRSVSDLEKKKKDLFSTYNSVRYDFNPESVKLTEYYEQEKSLNTRLLEIDNNGKHLTLNLMDLEKSIDNDNKDEKKNLIGTYNQLELFEQANRYAAHERESNRSSTEIAENDPALTREHIREGEAALRKFTSSVIKGSKSGLWKVFRDFKKHGVFDIRGAQVATGKDGTITREGWEQLHQALHIYRDKRFETFRLLFISPDGVINDQLAISSRLPSRVLLTPLFTNLGQQLIDYAQNTNTKIVLVHNHPSGNVEQSIEDEFITKELESKLIDAEGKTLLLGHIILDHNSFGLYETNTWNTIRVNTMANDPLMKTRLPDFTQEIINTPLVLRNIATQINESDRWNSTDWVPILFTNATARISGIRYYSKDWLKNTLSENVLRQFQAVGVQSGSVWAFPIISSEMSDDLELKEAIIEHMIKGCFMDVCIGSDTAHDIIGQHGASFYQRMTREEVVARTHVESTFSTEIQISEIVNSDKSVASNSQEEYGDSEQGDELFQTISAPGLSSALVSISKADIGKPNERIVITEQTPFIFTQYGLPNKHIEIYLDKIARSIILPISERHGHNNSITKENLLSVFSQIADPRAVFRSKDLISLIAVYDVVDVKNEPIIISLKNDKQSIEANLVTSVYGKPTRDIEFWIDGGQLLYINDLDKENAFMLPSRQLRMSNINASLSINIDLKSEIVNGDFVLETESRYDLKQGSEPTNKAILKSEVVSSYFVQESEQMYTGENGGRIMEEEKKEREEELQPFVLTSEHDRRIFYKSIGIDPTEPLFADGKSLQDITSVMIGPEENDESGLVYRKQYVLSADDVLYAAFVSDKDHEQGTPLSSIHGIDSFLAKEHFNLNGTYEGQHLFYKALAERNKFFETQKGLINHQQIKDKENVEVPRKSYNEINTERLLDTLKTSSAPFLGQPNEKSRINLTPQVIRSGVTGRAFKGMNQILAQIMIKEIGTKEHELITYEQAKRHGAGIKKGSPGINLTTFDVATQHQNVYRYYPISAVYHREKLPKVPEHKINTSMVVECEESVPEKFLGHYLAATSLGARFETTKSTMIAFKKSFEEELKQACEEKKFTKIFEIGNRASIICQNTMREIGEKARESERIRQKAFEIKSRYEPYNPVTGEKFVGLSAKKANYVMESRQSQDPRFLELTDILKAGLSLKDTVKEPLIISNNGKSRFFYNAKDIEGIPPMKVKTISLAQQHKNIDKELQL